MGRGLIGRCVLLGCYAISGNVTEVWYSDVATIPDSTMDETLSDCSDSTSKNILKNALKLSGLL